MVSVMSASCYVTSASYYQSSSSYVVKYVTGLTPGVPFTLQIDDDVVLKGRCIFKISEPSSLFILLNGVNAIFR